MDPTTEAITRSKRIAVQLGIVVCHAVLMAGVLGLVVAVAEMDLEGRQAVRLVFIALLCPAVISGVIYRWLCKSMPSSALTWWLAFLFTLTTFSMAAVLGSHYSMGSPFPGINRFQQGGLVFGAGFVSILASAVLFRLGASPKDINGILSRSRR